MKYIVGGNGWWAGRLKGFQPAGRLIDDVLFPDFAPLGPPPDAVPLTWDTYWYMISEGVVGKGYPYWEVSTRLLPPRQAFVLGQSQTGKPPYVLG